MPNAVGFLISPSTSTGALIRVPGSRDVDLAEATALVALVVGNAGLATAGGMYGFVYHQMTCTSLTRQHMPAQRCGIVLVGDSSVHRYHYVPHSLQLDY